HLHVYPKFGVGWKLCVSDPLVIQPIMKVNMLEWLRFIFATALLFIPDPVHPLLTTQTGRFDTDQHAGREYVLSIAPRQAHATEAAQPGLLLRRRLIRNARWLVGLGAVVGSQGG